MIGAPRRAGGDDHRVGALTGDAVQGRSPIAVSRPGTGIRGGPVPGCRDTHPRAVLGKA